MATCSECAFLDLDREYEPYDCKYWCEKCLEWRYANEAECYRFCRAYNRSQSVSDSYYNRSKNSQSNSGSGCFITTVVCGILGHEDRVQTLEILRAFRNNYLQKHKEHIDLLYLYDSVGPIIAENLVEEVNKKEIAANLYNLGIKKVAEFVSKKQYSKAITLYKDMTELLIAGYHIKKPDMSKERLESIDIEKSGHGKVYVKENSNI